MMDQDSYSDSEDSHHSQDNYLDEKYPSTPSEPSVGQQPHESCEACDSDNLEILYCDQCDSSYCGKCWPRQVPHKKGKLGGNGLPHTKADRAVVNRLDRAFHPPSDRSEQKVLHEDDQDTTWFSVERRDGELPVLCGHGRYAALMASSPMGRSSRYPQLVSFIGQTGAGKSTLVKILIEQKAQPDSHEEYAASRTPIPGSVMNDSTPTTGDVHLYADPATFFGTSPMLYADCEGLDGGEAPPVSVAAQQWDPSSTNPIPRHSGSKRRNKDISRYWAARQIRRELTWARDNEERQKREFAVAHLYPRLLYTFSDVIVFVLQNGK
jgi:energy-coupling factor transporter ATP-binding protein EcfA2